MYDSKQDTLNHINRVRELLNSCVLIFLDRAKEHDKSKLQPPEKPIFDEFTPKLKDSTYGSDEYKSYLAEMGEALKHHYANNSHHPEHYENGVDGMSLFDLVEMVCDWKAATERHDNGDIYKSLIINADRFSISPQLQSVLLNTVNELLEKEAE